MAILNQETVEISGGFSKEIETGSMGLMMNILQQHQYAYPIKSTIRELVSNGLDSIAEKNIALAILSGEAKEEDFFVQKDGEIYKDSKFNPDYYDRLYLSATNEVWVIYNDGGELSKDSVIIRDYGVGLGGTRLEKYFNLGYSSKRLLSKALGKFGIGAKSPLSTGCPYYTITSRYNGCQFVFNVYAHRMESIIPRWNTETGKENPSYTFSNGYVAYYTETFEENMLEIEIGTKKHHKSQYLDAVTTQLLYFKNVRLFVNNPTGVSVEIPVQANIMYEDDMIVLSTNSNYSKPHLLLNGVNYGYINFQELELEEKLGNVGIKVNPDLVSVNPSRESLIWDDKTREVIVDRFNEVVSIAQGVINQELQEIDFLKWMKICAQASTNSLWTKAGENTIIGRLAAIIDMTKVQLSYPLNKDLKFNQWLLDGVKCQRVSLSVERKGSVIKKKVEYSGWRSAFAEGLPLLIHNGPISNRKNKYILQHVHQQGFILLQLEYAAKTDGTRLEAQDIFYSPRVEEANSHTMEEKSIAENLGRFGLAGQKVADLHNYIYAADGKVWYDSIVVPDEFKANEEEQEEQEEETNDIAKKSAEERRKIAGTTILHTPRINGDYRKSGRVYEMQKIEMFPYLVDMWTNEEVFWSNQDCEALLHTASLICRPVSDIGYAVGKPFEQHTAWKAEGYAGPNLWEWVRCVNFHNDAPVRLIKVAQNNVKYYQDFKHITKFFKEIRNKTITMSNALIRWNTARLLQEKLNDLRFLNGFHGLNLAIATKYRQLRQYVDTYWRALNISPVVGANDTISGQLISHMDKVGQFQLFVRANPDDKEAISQLAVELFNPQAGVEIEDGKAIDTELYDMYLELVDWCQPVKTLMNAVRPLTDNQNISPELEEEIRHYFKYRGVSI